MRPQHVQHLPRAPRHLRQPAARQRELMRGLMSSTQSARLLPLHEGCRRQRPASGAPGKWPAGCRTAKSPNCPPVRCGPVGRNRRHGLRNWSRLRRWGLGWRPVCVCVCVATLQEVRPPDQQGPREVTVVVALMICCHGQSSCLPRHSQSPDQIAACPTPPLLRARPCDRSPGSLKVAQYLTWSPNARKQAAV